MTDLEINAIQPGPALDMLVAEAIGHGNLWFPPACPQVGPGWGMCIKTMSYPGDPSKKEWSLFCNPPPFSTDMNAAMFAGQQCGLFKPNAYLIGTDANGEWRICRNLPPFHLLVEGTGNTLPLALCRAILNLAKKNT